MTDVREANGLATMANGADRDEYLVVRVGHQLLMFRETDQEKNPIVTNIRVSRDGHGNAGLYDRVTVWAGDRLLMEAPLHNLESVSYV